MSNEEQERESEIQHSNNIKIAVTAVVSVILGIAFVLALITYGISVQQRINRDEEKKAKEDAVVSIIGVDYKTHDYAYDIPANIAEDDSFNNYLFYRIGIDQDKQYFVVDSKDKLDSVLSAAGIESYPIDADTFFLTSSIVVVNTEAEGLSGYSVTAVSRDENYNLQIDVKKSVDSDATKKGHVAFVEVSNIQPSGVTVNER